ncbi:MAG TPA: ABC transporter permease [Candidatus Saccharimonadales bacterium]|nr:ABC transporter permease [Candidatus Saccharimonadales bacterium]
MNSYTRTVLILGRNLILRSGRNLGMTSLFLLLPTVLLAIFGLVNGADTSKFTGLFAIFNGIAVMLLGVVGLATMLPIDKKMGVLRRLQATPFKASQLMLGSLVSSLVLAFVAVSIMTIVALVFFTFQMHGSYLDFALFTLVGLIMSCGIGLAIGGWASNDTSATFVSQTVFLGSLALSGVWIPREALPGWLHDLSAYLPLTPVIEGGRAIVAQGDGLLDLGPQLAIMTVWAVIAFVLGARIFRWESGAS